MRISPINTYNNIFKSTKRTTYQIGQDKPFIQAEYNIPSRFTINKPKATRTKILTSNSTWFFRDDIPWDYLGEIFDERLFPKGKVNIHNFACSDGSEAYSLIIALIEQLGEKKASRFFPIQATDIDPEVIKMAKSGKIEATLKDIQSITSKTYYSGIGKYFTIDKQTDRKYILIPKEILTKNVEFSVSSMEKGLNKVKKGNNIILCRNFWKYLSADELARTSWKLREKVDENSLVIIGKFDNNINGTTPDCLSKLGFDYFSDFSFEENLLCYNPFYDCYENNKKGFLDWYSYIRNYQKQYIPTYMK